MKTLTALLCWKSCFQTRLPTALFPTHHPGFAASSALGNFSPHTQLTFPTENWATVNILHDQFRSPTKYDWPFSSALNQCLVLLICSTFYLSLIYFCSHIPRSFPSSIQRSLHLCCSGCLQNQKLFSLGKMQSLCLCRPSPVPEALLPLRHLSWSSLLPSPWDSFCSCPAPALGGVCQPWICFQPSGQVEWGCRSQGMQLQGQDQLCPPCREVTRGTPGMYRILNLYALDLHAQNHTSSYPYGIISPC